MPEEKKKQKSDQDIKKDASDPVDAKTKPWRPPKKIPPKEDDEMTYEPSEEIEAYGIGSTEGARHLLKEYGIPLFQEGVISGVAGVLLNEGKRRNFDVISILAEARPNYPDARAAAKVIESIDQILLKVGIDVKPLYKEAEGIESRIKAMQKQAKPSAKKAMPKPEMYG